MPCMQRLTVSRCSFIRTVTVGSGIEPDLLTLALAINQATARRSRAPATNRSYRRWGISPRPENAAGWMADAANSRQGLRRRLSRK